MARQINDPLHIVDEKLFEIGGDSMTDTFRKNYGKLTDEQSKQAMDVKEKAEELLALFNTAVPQDERSERSRCMAVARTQLETTIMWAVKAITTTTE